MASMNSCDLGNTWVDEQGNWWVSIDPHGSFTSAQITNLLENGFPTPRYQQAYLDSLE